MGRGSARRVLSRDFALRLWFDRQGLWRPHHQKLTKGRFLDHLERTGGLQLDSINVLDRAHYLTLWSRYGMYDRRKVDRWIYQDRVAFEYWGHEASVLPASRLPLALRAMRCFKASGSWWKDHLPSPADRRRVLMQIREDGPLDSRALTKRAGEHAELTRRALMLLWHEGKIAISRREQFRRYYDLPSRVYPDVEAASRKDWEDHWLLGGLRGNGVASERQLTGYLTSPRPSASLKKEVLHRCVLRGLVEEVELEGSAVPHYALPEHLDRVGSLPRPEGATLLCPFDSLLWQRGRAKEWLDFDYKVEIYVPKNKRKFGYYAMPILIDGQLVGRVDAKFDREASVLKVRALAWESRRGKTHDKAALGELLHSLAAFLGASSIERTDEKGRPT